MRRVVVFAALTLIADAAACGLFPSIDGLTGEPVEGGLDGEGAADGLADASSGGPSDGPSDGNTASDAGDAADGGDAACPSGRGPAMVSVGAFCIDSTEVTMAQYSAFVADVTAKGVGTSGQPPECAWNTSYGPPNMNGCRNDMARPNLPVNCVDWCDARAFCQWSGKRLCGAIGGGAVAPDAFSNASTSQWAYACTRAGQRAYPYGPAYDAAAGCNGAEAALGVDPWVVDVGSRSKCVGGFSGVFDMSGNVWEWLDSCWPCAGGRCCAHLGGSETNSALNLACAPTIQGALSEVESSQDIGTGIRCCSH